MLPSAWLQRIGGHVSNPEQVITPMREAGYTLVRRFDSLPDQSFMIFTPESP